MNGGLFDGPGGWKLAPEGAAVHPGERAAVVADVHLGYEWARAAGGDTVPAHSLRETTGRLAALLGRVEVNRLVVAGDLVESRLPCPRTARDLAALTRWLADRGVELVPLAGNHDPPRRPPWPPALEVAGWTVAHGHRPLDAPRTITGHLHPVLRAAGVCAPCFVVGEASILLPAFSANAAGVGLASLGLGPGPVRCVASAGGELLDFGPLPDLLGALRATGPVGRRA